MAASRRSRVGLAGLSGALLAGCAKQGATVQGQEIHDLHAMASGDVAVASMLIRGSGTLKHGIHVDRWLRATSGCLRSDGRWSITHEHISVPVDLATGTVTPDLVP